MIRITMRLSLVLAIGLLLAGCTYSRKVSDYAERTELRTNSIEEVTGARLTPDDEILVCARGWPAAIAPDKPAVEFEIRFPATLPKDMVDQPSEQAAGKPAVVSYPLPPDRIQRRCSESKGGRQIPLHNVDAEEFWARSKRPLSDGVFTAELDDSATAAAIFIPRGTRSVQLSRFFYVHGDPTSAEPRLVAIELPEEEVQPNKAARLAVPPAAAADGIIFVGKVFHGVLQGVFIVLVIGAVVLVL